MAEEKGKESEHETTDETDEETNKENGDSESPSDNNDMRTIIREEIAKALKATRRDASSPSISRTGTIEREAREAVEREAARLTKEKEHEKEHETLKTAKAEPEKTPVKMRKLTQLLWGSNE